MSGKGNADTRAVTRECTTVPHKGNLVTPFLIAYHSKAVIYQTGGMGSVLRKGDAGQKIKLACSSVEDQTAAKLAGLELRSSILKDSFVITFTTWCTRNKHYIG